MLLNWGAVTEELLPELSEQDRAVIETTSYGSTRKLGAHPALILVDFQYAYVGDDVPIIEQLKQHPAAGGAAAWQAFRASLPVLHEARKLGIPVVLSRIAYAPSEAESNTFSLKRGASIEFIDGSRGARLVEELEPQESDFLLRKEAASCFHRTDLKDHLFRLGVDTVIIGGLSTSGCVRATAVDAAGYGLSVAVLRDASADRIDLSHRVALFDIWMKYGEVFEVSDAIEYFTSIDSHRVDHS
jgi:nicotinamidase-related amidase